MDNVVCRSVSKYLHSREDQAVTMIMVGVRKSCDLEDTLLSTRKHGVASVKVHIAYVLLILFISRPRAIIL